MEEKQHKNYILKKDLRLSNDINKMKTTFTQLLKNLRIR